MIDDLFVPTILVVGRESGLIRGALSIFNF